MKVVILGIGSAQVDAIQYCKNNGWEVHGLSYRGEGPGEPLVDYFSLIDITDSARVIEYTKSIDADIVYSVGSDVAMSTVGLVGLTCALPYFVDANKATLLQRKGDLRRFLTTTGINPITYMVGKELNDFTSWNLYPAIIKPFDSQGQRGIYTLCHSDDIRRYFTVAKEHSSCGHVIIEEYIDGPEVSVNAFVRDGRVEDLIISDRFVVNDMPGGIVSGHRIPSIHTDIIQDKVAVLANKCISALEICNGPVYMQMKIQDDDVFIIEITPRLDGCHLWRLIKYKYGIDLLDKTFSLLADKPYAASVNPNDGTWLLHFDLQRPGTQFATHSQKQNVIYECNYYNDGDIVRPINGHLEKTGYKIFVDNNA